MFYLNFVKDKYKVPYIWGTTKGENHYHIHEEPQTTLQKKEATQHLVVLLSYNFFLRFMPWRGPIPLSGLHTSKSDPGHEYYGNLNIVIFVGIRAYVFFCFMLLTWMLWVCSQTYHFLTTLNLYCIDVLYQFECMNIFFFCQKNAN